MTLGTPWTQSMPSRDVNAVTRLAEASWWRDKGKCEAVNYLKSDQQIDVPAEQLLHLRSKSVIKSRSVISSQIGELSHQLRVSLYVVMSQNVM